MRFFFDQNFPLRLARMMHLLCEAEGHTCTHLNDLFDQEVDDEEWLPQLAAQGSWTVISGDCKIKRNPTIKKVWEESGLTSFFLSDGWPQQNAYEIAWQFIKRWPAIVMEAGRAEVGSAFRVPFGKGAKSVVPWEGWVRRRGTGLYVPRPLALPADRLLVAKKMANADPDSSPPSQV